ncbi:MAG: aminotransferase [Pseudomonadota bacterium]
MSFVINSDLADTQLPPVMEARRWIADKDFGNMPLINVSQAAPLDPPPEALRRVMAEAVMENPEAHLYGPVRGMPALREKIAETWSGAYGAPVSADQVSITSGCNQAFCAAVASVAQKGDAVILPTPWYFNHEMHLTMNGIEVIPLPCGDGMVPDVERAKALISDRVKALVLVTPNNPTGAEYPAGVVSAFFDLAETHGLALIVDETYRDFDSRTGAPHDLFTRPNWGDTLIQLYSFSKAYRLTGHRVGALVTGASRQAEIEKYLDTQTICPNQIGQIAALWGMNNLGDWVAGERAEILARRAAVEAGLNALPDWTVKGVGAYFAYVAHSFEARSDVVAKALVDNAAILMLPGTMFAPLSGTPNGLAEGHLRIAFANIDASGIDEMVGRLSGFSL